MNSIFYQQRLRPTERGALLRRVVQDIKRDVEMGRRPVVVFDLDGTLLDNRRRVVRIMHELAEHWEERHPAAATKCRLATDAHIVYGFNENLRQVGVDDESLHAEGIAFWKERFFTDDYVRVDAALSGAKRFATACYEAGANLVYLTGRDLPMMALGTFASLRDEGFPIGVVGTELVTKPAFETPDAVFKKSVAPDLVRLGRVNAVFDNEPANCNLFLEAYPDCTSVLLDTQHAPEPPQLLPGVLVIDTFEMDD